MSKLWPSGVVFALVSLSAAAFAQVDTPPAYIAVLDGDVTLVRESQPVTAIVNMPIVSGDRLTTSAGRVEVLYPDGAALDLDEGANAEFASDGRVRLSSGRAILVVPAGTNSGRYEIDTPAGAVITRGPGKYRADAVGPSAWALSARANNSDGFEGWSDALRAARSASAVSPSAEHLPEELQPYDTTLDQNGTWQYAPTYGYVWYPRVENDWRPYYEGTWTSVPSYGWTWVGVHRWEYPTHHYGRWGYANSRWFWIPGRAYAPAWVAWGYASDYVSWCPLGIDSRPVFAMTVGYGNPWTGWTVLQRSHFGGRGYVPRLAVPPHQMPSQTPFVVQRSAPTVAPRAEGIPAAGAGIAVPRQAPAAGRVATPAATTQAPAVSPQPAQSAPQAPAVAIPRNPNADRPQSAPGAPRYAPNYAPAPPATPTAPAQATPPAAAPAPHHGGRDNPPPTSTPPPQTATPRTAAPAAPGGGGGTAPRSTPPASATPPPPSTGAPAPHASGSGAPSSPAAPAHKAAPAQKPADSGKARGRGGL